MGTKAWWKSKTIRVGAVTLVVGVLTELQNFYDTVPELNEPGWVASALGVAMIVLRFATSQPVGKSDG